MATSDYTTTLLVNQSPKEAFTAINNISGWWTENIEGGTNKLNDEFKVTFGTTRKAFKIIELVPNKKVVWQVTDSHMPWNNNQQEWTGTKVSFEVSEKDTKTQIRFTHFGLVPAFNCFDACSNAWGQYLQQSLLNLITTGKGNADAKKGNAKTAKN